MERRGRTNFLKGKSAGTFSAFRPIIKLQVQISNEHSKSHFKRCGRHSSLTESVYHSEATLHDDFNIPPLKQPLELQWEFERHTVLKIVKKDRLARLAGRMIPVTSKEWRCDRNCRGKALALC